MCDVDNNGNFNDVWNNVIWSNCYVSKNTLINIKWNGKVLYLPNNYVEKLINRYGDDWNIPKKSKGIIPPKRVL